MSFTVSLTYGKKYTVGGFTTHDEAMDFIAKYKGNEHRMEKDFDDLPFFAVARDLDFDNNLMTIKEHGLDSTESE